jgi:hypothetical protein
MAIIPSGLQIGGSLQIPGHPEMAVYGLPWGDSVDIQLGFRPTKLAGPKAG